jgi:peptide/nickel transport system permease protein
MVETIAPAAPVRRRIRLDPRAAVGGTLVALLLLVALAAALLAPHNPLDQDLLSGLLPPSWSPGGDPAYLFGTDSLGRDVYSRVVYGARISLVIGITVAVISIAIGLFIGLISGYIRWIDAIVMRLMDGLMAIPAILLAIALVSLFRAGLFAVIVAIIVPEIPRVVRLVRSIVLSVREEPYVEAAICAGTPTHLLLFRHVLPNTIPALIVQGTFICANAILLEAILSFLGIGIPPETPTWGNIMAEGRGLFRIYPHNIFFPGICLALTVLAVNVLGDGLRDRLDPKLARRV